MLFQLTSLALLLLISQAEPTKARTNKTELLNQFLEGQNAARKAVGVPPLVWDPMLSTYARTYSSMVRRKDCKLIHSPSYGFGENLFWGEGRKWGPKDAVAAWLSEKRWYHYNNNSCSSSNESGSGSGSGSKVECGHYTQIVWRDTKWVGCSKIICDTGDSFITCEYFPPGNYIGERPY